MLCKGVEHLEVLLKTLHKELDITLTPNASETLAVLTEMGAFDEGGAQLRTAGGTVLIPWAIVELILGNFPLAIGLAVLYGVIVVIRNLIEPKIVGSQIGLNPIITLLSVYVGLRFFGLLGIFTPIFVVLAKQIYLCFKAPSKEQI